MGEGLGAPDDGSATALVAQLDEFRKLHSLFPIQQMMILLTVAKHGETTLSELCKELDIAQSTASKSLTYLGGMPEREGEFRFGFISSRKDDVDYRKNIIELTPKGKAFVQKVLHPGS